MPHTLRRLLSLRSWIPATGRLRDGWSASGAKTTNNNISKLTANVLNHFMQDGPLPTPDASEIRCRGRFESTPALNYHLPAEVGS